MLVKFGFNYFYGIGRKKLKTTIWEGSKNFLACVRWTKNSFVHLKLWLTLLKTSHIFERQNKLLGFIKEAVSSG